METPLLKRVAIFQIGAQIKCCLSPRKHEIGGAAGGGEIDSTAWEKMLREAGVKHSFFFFYSPVKRQRISRRNHCTKRLPPMECSSIRGDV